MNNKERSQVFPAVFLNISGDALDDFADPFQLILLMLETEYSGFRGW